MVDDGSGFARNTYNVMDFTTSRPQLLPLVTKNFTTTSACGVCGSESIDAVRQKSRYTLLRSWAIDPRAILSAARELTDHQPVFARTGGVHAAALVDLEGNLLVVREDVGRHNAVDKVIGWALLEDRLPLRDCFLLVSSRASFEIAQKAYMAGIPMLACVSAATSLAVETAEEFGMTLVGFTRAAEDGVRPHERLYPPRSPRPLRRRRLIGAAGLRGCGAAGLRTPRAAGLDVGQQDRRDQCGQRGGRCRRGD